MLEIYLLYCNIGLCIAKLYIANLYIANLYKNVLAS